MLSRGGRNSSDWQIRTGSIGSDSQIDAFERANAVKIKNAEGKYEDGISAFGFINRNGQRNIWCVFEKFERLIKRLMKNNERLLSRNGFGHRQPVAKVGGSKACEFLEHGIEGRLGVEPRLETHGKNGIIDILRIA
jgi:hypothetical protein